MNNETGSASTRLAVLIAALLLIPSLVPAGEVGYSAMVMDVRGQAFVTHAGARTAVDLGRPLYPGDSVETAVDGTLTVAYLESGLEEHWAGGAKFSVEKNGSRPAPARVVQRNRIVLPRIASSQTGSATTKGLSFSEDLEVGGLSNTRILEDRPVFRWTGDRSVKQYRIKLTSLSGERLLWQKTTRRAELAYPPDSPSLEPGGRYEWTVEAVQNGVPTSEKRSCFSLPPSPELEALRTEIQARRMQLEAKPDDHASRLRHILFLEERRLLDEALIQLDLLREHGGLSASLKHRSMQLLRLRQAACRAE